MRMIPALNRPFGSRAALVGLVVGAVAITVGVALMLTLARTVPSSAGAQEAPSVQAQLDEVHAATAQFQSVEAAKTAGYAPFLSCIREGSQGAMGIHYVNSSLVDSAVIDATRPQALLYEPEGDRLRLVGVEYVVMADAWQAAHSEPPSLFGQSFHLVSSPNRYGLPTFYALHAWLWESNPQGMFADWNPRVFCPRLGGE